LKGTLVPGSVIIFDELINYPGWQEGEYRAFMEYVAENYVAFEYIAYARTGSQVAVKLTQNSRGTVPPSGELLPPKHAADIAPRVS
jgi:hypothetical protein